MNFLRNEDQTNLDILETMLKEKDFTLLVPTEIVTEWKRNSQEHIRKYEIIIKEHFPSEVSWEQLILDLKYKRLEELSNRISNILSQGTILKSNKGVHDEVMKRYKEGKAPFHNKKNSNNDALIYFTTISYLKKKGIKEIIFVSNNTEDFSNSKNRKQLHSELAIPEIVVNYFTDIAYITGPHSREYISKETLSSNKRIIYLHPELKHKPFLDQIKEMVVFFGKELPIIPHHILSNIFPLRIEGKGGSLSLSNVFVTNNLQLIELLSSVDFQNGRMIFKSEVHKREKDVIRTFVSFLSSNKIYKISGYYTNLKSVNIAYEKRIKCSCLVCSFRRLDFVNSFTKVREDNEGDFESIMKRAYFHFNIGNLTTSTEISFEAFSKCVQEGSDIKSLIIIHNLQKIEILSKVYGKQYTLAPQINGFLINHLFS
jgi:hypothetical protein